MQPKLFQEYMNIIKYLNNHVKTAFGVMRVSYFKLIVDHFKH